MAKSKTPEILSLSVAELEALLEVLGSRLPEELFEKVRGLLRTLQWLMGVIEQKRLSIRRLRRMIFGPKTEKTEKLFGPGAAGKDSSTSTPKEKIKPKGHGRKKAADYPGAQVVPVPHPGLCAGAVCPKCLNAKVRALAPVRLIRIVAQPMISAIKYELERFRCVLCGEVFTAPPPPQALQGKYDQSVGVMLALSRYGLGVPMYRTEKWQQYFGVPLAASTQWELIAAASPAPLAVYDALRIAAAQAELFHTDDTKMYIQELARQRAEAEAAEPKQTKKPRTGCFTTGIVARLADHQVALFMTGAQYAGENLDQVLHDRPAHLPKPLHMSDGLSRNECKEFETILCNCMAHGRRGFVDVAEYFPEQCLLVIESLRQVYQTDAQAKKQRLSDQERLELHQQQSQPIMEQLKKWLEEQFEQKKVEPNSSLGQAMRYMLKRWGPLTRFLQVPGAPLDNNIAERMLKMAILHRKNSLRFKTHNGARIGDAFMSLIHTCALNGINAFDYFMALNQNAQALLQAPAQWLPWNYAATLATLKPPNTS